MKAKPHLAVLAVIVAIGALYFGRAAIGGQSDVNQVIAALSRDGEDVRILSKGVALKGLSASQVQSLLSHKNRYIHALAITEFKGRHDRAPLIDIRRSFENQALKDEELRFDPHATLSPDTAVFLASADYLSSLDKSVFIQGLFSRREVWAAPWLFAGIFQQAGEGWVSSAVQAAQDDQRRRALTYLLAVSTTDSNSIELARILTTDRSLLWEGAARACERVNSQSCWVALSDSLSDQDEAGILLGRMIQFRKRRATADELFGRRRPPTLPTYDPLY